ncbi:MAG: recombinase zinc beta ribbon domain-containing protein [Lachnospiraceae bacterium]|nr:recombinase zinc beta ribbon domain-containing protein [Lachnospiraceae bacterium]
MEEVLVFCLYAQSFAGLNPTIVNPGCFGFSLGSSCTCINLPRKGELLLTIMSSLAQEESRSILKNEKYKGCALLQKTYTPDFLTKKAVANDGTVPQYYVEDSHPAIIAPEQFALVQDIFAERSHDPKHSGATIFSGKIRCGCCGGWYGSKVWHSNNKYRRVIWQCNHKFKDKTRCKTPHLTEDEIKAAFVRMVNKLYADREFYITELTSLMTESIFANPSSHSSTQQIPFFSKSNCRFFPTSMFSP